MERARRSWVRGAVTLVATGAVVWALVAAPASASPADLTQKEVRKIAKMVATKVFNAHAATLKDACPAGTTLVAGGCMERRPPGGRPPWVNANKSCGTLGRRLPTPGELVAAFATPGITAATEITSDIYISDGDGSTFTEIMAVVTAAGSVGGQSNLGTVAAYRCVAPLPSECLRHDCAAGGNASGPSRGPHHWSWWAPGCRPSPRRPSSVRRSPTVSGTARRCTAAASARPICRPAASVTLRST